ncbi:hypothetical protein GLOIN_2v1569696 [Rhizophagus clarus]|nr:hypothetical protein GLOIN_2v1569696 [Rhizophagus clarus]
MELSYSDFLQNFYFNSYDIEWLFSLEIHNNNNGYELLDKTIRLEDEKKSGDKRSDDIEGVNNIVEDINILNVENIDILDDIEGEDLYNNDGYVEEDKLELKEGMTFDTWKIAKTYLENFAKQQEFFFRKRRREIDPIDHITIKKRTFECSYARTHNSDKIVKEEDRR